MRTAIFCFIVVSFLPCPAIADPCAGAESQLALVSKQLARGAAFDAERLLGPIESTHPDCHDAVLDRARIQTAKGEAANAEDTFMRYNGLEPRDAKGHAYHAQFLLDQSEYQRADGLSLLAMEENPDEPAALAVRGQILGLKGNSQDAMQLLEDACRRNPDYAEARFQLGVLYDRAKRPTQAVKYFEELVAIDPFDPRGWDYLALNLEPLAKVGDADKAYKRGLQTNQPGQHFDAFLDYNYGRFLMKSNDFSASKEHLDRAVELTPQVRAPWYDRARLHLRLKNYQLARADAEKAASIEDPQGFIVDQQVYALLEQIYIRLGETVLALKYAELGRETNLVPSTTDRTR